MIGRRKTPAPPAAGTYTQLKSGGWGVRVERADIAAGQLVMATKRSGEKKAEIVERVLWRDAQKGLAICSIVPDPAPRHGIRAPCAECGRGPGMVECTDSSGLRGMCCTRCSRMASHERSFG